ncbi:DUF2157 domain-containing protein [Microcoleus sp. FACHB-SPT15]|uniref:DUF2157 domain-containing protein n=1 Tax=Microcoleus sp. FACHB-SPT15 TaxID=2692830 RepID=UPI00177F31DD|nr:DUF2157 domain-containing protein [Microcoleus sp. FACHB-SPT15]MBD1809852.1 DUF2157 domain-containing protein [Microcoleus sp. FACHB-SPT15]
MTSQPNRSLRIELTVKASQPQLLEGLDVWLRLGLLSDAQVRQLCRKYLSSPLPEPVTTPAPVPQLAASDTNEVDTPTVKTPTDSYLSRMWHSLKDELSVRWLLFLGVFLVVVSSGVLAATQWKNFPAAGQYGVLWAYTVIFWFGSFWAGRQDLQLTAQTLRLVTLLLIPVNFWAMDSFGLWRNPWEWIVIAIASLTLTTITLLNQDIKENASRFAPNAFLILWLSYLHWGWQWSGFPLVAVYLGMVGTAILLPKRYALPQAEELITADSQGRGIMADSDTRTATRSSVSSELSHSSPLNSDPLQPPLKRGENLVKISRVNSDLGASRSEKTLPSTPIGSLIVIYALAVLLGRAIFVIQLPVAQLGLAIGMCGWLLARLGQLETTPESASFQSKIWEGIGGSLLLIGWLVSVREAFPWQATAVSGLALWFLANRLQRFWERGELIAIFAVGLQAHWLVWRLVPPELQQEIVTFFTQLTNSQTVPDALLGLALFPYLVAMVALTDWIYRAEKREVASFGEQLTFVFGLLLTLVSLLNPTVRSLNLFLSTITLATVTVRWSPTRTELVYLTHVTGLLSIASTIDWLFPNLSQTVWASLLLIAMVIEWSYSVFSHSPIWQRSAWHLGFVLSGLSYTLLLNDTYPSGVFATPVNQEAGLLWLLTPLCLTGVASRVDEPRRRQASWLSVAALVVAQALTLWIPGVRLINLSFATGLMLVNTRYLRQTLAARITIGFALSFIGVLLWESVPGLPRLTVAGWFLVGAIATLVLWLIRNVLQQRSGTIAALYAEASDNWAVGLCCCELLMLTVHSIGSYLALFPSSWEYLAASTLTGVAIFCRYWQQPSNTVVYSLSWAVEIVLAQAILLSGGATLELATANIILGLVTLIASDWWLVQERQPVPLRSIEILPLLYALLGIGLRWGYFTSWTGLLILGAALTGIGVGRRREEWKLLTYFSLAGISLAWYELVIYQMLQTQGGSLVDALTILAGVATAIALAYRLLAWVWHSRSERLWRLSVAELKSTAHIHWAIASLLLVFAVITAVSVATVPSLAGTTIVLSLVLGGYALVQGRRNPDVKAAQEWVYVGVIEIVATGASVRLLWTELSVLDAWFALIACGLAYAMYELPWHKWGWHQTPWKHSAILLPLLTACLTTEAISAASLLLVAGFYAWIAKRSSNIRLTYISVLLIDWAIARWFERLQLTDPLWYATVLGLSLLYVAQFDPDLKRKEQRQLRHYLRILGSGAICLVALLFHQETGIIPGIISIITIFAGLTLRVRAFLFVGTATFLLTAFYQLIVLISRYPFIKWVVGLIVGIIFIGMAANFETRRNQIASVLHTSRSELGAWE